MRPHRRQPTRLPRPWDSPGKNTGVGCHFLLQCMKVKRESEVAQSCPTLSDPMGCSLPGSSAHGIIQARVLEWGAIACYLWLPGNVTTGSCFFFFSPLWFSGLNMMSQALHQQKRFMAGKTCAFYFFPRIFQFKTRSTSLVKTKSFKITIGASETNVSG